MADDLNGVPSTRPQANALHVAAAEQEATYKRAVEVVFAKMSVGRKDLFTEGAKLYAEAKDTVDKVGADKIMAAHNAVLPSAADLDAVADEQKAAEATEAKFEAEVKALMESEGLSWKKAAKRIQEAK